MADAPKTMKAGKAGRKKLYPGKAATVEALLESVAVPPAADAPPAPIALAAMPGDALAPPTAFEDAMSVASATVAHDEVPPAADRPAEFATAAISLTQAANATFQGAIELNGKIFDALRAQSGIALETWRQTLGAGSLSEAVVRQSSGVRKAYEVAATHWKDIASTAQRIGTHSAPHLRAARKVD